VTRIWRHLQTLWPGWTVLAPLPFVLHGAWAASRDRFRWEHAALLCLVAILFATGPGTKKLLLGAYPIGLVGLLYDAMKTVQNVGVSADRVHLCDLRSAEVSLFGVRMDGDRVTLQDWFHRHPSAVLDAVCAVPYATFLLVCFAFATWLFFADYARMVRFTWSFLALNLAGFVTYHVYPAAPPWYYHAHGCLIDVLAHADEGAALARVDARLGIHYFGGMYNRSSVVFGAMPSLHVAYALLVALEGWPAFAHGWRVASFGFFALMCFSAVYLDHHWVLDVLAGIAYSVVVVLVARAATRWRWRRHAPRMEGPDGTRGLP
jgi:membrane-associated phospholipid phosphatase